MTNAIHSSTQTGVLGKLTTKQSVTKVAEFFVHSITVCLADNTPIATTEWFFLIEEDALVSMESTVQSDLEHVVRNALRDHDMNVDIL